MGRNATPAPDAPEVTPEDTPAPDAPEAPPALVMTASERKALARQQAADAPPAKDPKENFSLVTGSEWYAVPGSKLEVGLTVTDAGHQYVTTVGPGRTRSIPLVAFTVLEDHGLV